MRKAVVGEVASGVSPTEMAWPEGECRQVLQNAPWPIFVWDTETGQILEANGAASVRYGRTREEFLGLSVESIVSPRVQVALQQMVYHGMGAPPVDLTSEHVSATGEVFKVDVTSFPVRWQNRVARFSLIRDHRPRVDLVQRSPHIAELENMARVSAAIAHNFDNLLSIIQAAAEELRDEAPPELAQRAGVIVNAVRSATRLAQQLMHFGHRTPGKMEQVDLRCFVEDDRDILVAAVGRGVELRLELKACSWVRADVEQCREALLNLVVNAREAMQPDGGKCTIRIGREQLAQDRADLDLRQGHYITLAVLDEGCGMSEETYKRALEPYFTTKSQGHGLGLASVYGIMRLHGGGVQIFSDEHKGTEVRLYFPEGERRWFDREDDSR